MDGFFNVSGSEDFTPWHFNGVNVGIGTLRELFRCLRRDLRLARCRARISECGGEPGDAEAGDDGPHTLPGVGLPEGLQVGAGTVGAHVPATHSA